jgi:hypothetical protein
MTERDTLRRILAILALALAVAAYLLGASPPMLAVAVGVGLLAAALLL